MASADGYLRYVPYEAAYPHQRDAMASIAEAIDAGEDVLFEGATGTGKTLAALAPALDRTRETDETVVITTNVHQQARQFVAEASAIADQAPLRAVVFRGKGSMCHLDVGYEECQVLRDATRDLVDLEADRRDLSAREAELLEASRAGDESAAAARSAVLDELEDVADEVASLREEEAVCEHYYRNLAADTDEFYAWLYDDVRSPEAIYERADAEGFCGYELVKEGMAGVDLVVCNYHHLLDPFVREQFFRWIDRDPGEVVAVFDEAHNLAEAAREHATRTLAERTLTGSLAELDGRDEPAAAAGENVLGAFRAALAATYGSAVDPTDVGGDWTDVPIANESGRDDLTVAFLEEYQGPGIRADLARAIDLGEALDRRYERAYRRGESDVRRESPVRTAATFVEAWLDAGETPARHPLVSVRSTGDGLAGRAELYTALPRRVTAPLFESLAATVLMSATLRPFDVAADVLGLDGPISLAYGQQFPESRRRTYAVGVPALFASRRDDPDRQAAVTAVLEDAVRYTPGNVLAFFPSYAEADRYHGRVSARTRYLDEPGTAAETLKTRFVADDDGVLFTSLWGTLAEGVSFDGDDARTVVVVGVPYPRLDERREAVQAAYEETVAPGAGWRYAVEIPTVRKTRQALGRVVRSPEDFGARVLVDERYTAGARETLGEYSVHGTFPADERAEIVDVDPEKVGVALRNFYADLDAWPGDPPAP